MARRHTFELVRSEDGNPTSQNANDFLLLLSLWGDPETTLGRGAFQTTNPDLADTLARTVEGLNRRDIPTQSRDKFFCFGNSTVY